MGSFCKYDIMTKLHKNLQSTVLDPKEGRRGFLCNNSSPVRRPFLGIEEKTAYNQLGTTLRDIHDRLLEQYGYLYICQLLDKMIPVEPFE